MKKLIYISVILFTGLYILNSCTSDSIEELEPYANPFQDSEIPNDTLVIDSFSIAGIHQNILNPSCNVLGCHDGSFEPDFRTVQSSYATLVYHPIIKNNAAEDFEFRVVPFDKEKSVLYERITNCCFVNENDRMPQDNIGVPLDQELVDAIGRWIDEGAKDIDGTTPVFPNTQPKVSFYVAVDQAFQYAYSNDRINNNWYEPFIVPNEEEFFSLIFLMVDDVTAAKDLTDVEVKLSYDRDDFDDAISIPAVLASDSNNDYWMIQVYTPDLNRGVPIYFRIYTNDGDHEELSESPNNDTFYLYKTYFSFLIIQ